MTSFWKRIPKFLSFLLVQNLGIFLYCILSTVNNFFRYLAMEKKCFTLFATHFHELTRLPEICPTAHNLHVTLVATEKTITPLFQVQSGPCDKSFGIHCARMVGFPDDVIQASKSSLEDSFEHFPVKETLCWKIILSALGLEKNVLTICRLGNVSFERKCCVFSDHMLLFSPH